MSTNTNLFLAAFALAGMVALAEEQTPTTATGAKAAHDTARKMKKGAHRLSEAVACAESDVKCLEKKAQHRAEEASDYATDKTEEAKAAAKAAAAKKKQK